MILNTVESRSEWARGPGGVLALGAHPDDLELGCGATLAKLAARGVPRTGL